MANEGTGGGRRALAVVLAIGAAAAVGGAIAARPREAPPSALTPIADAARARDQSALESLARGLEGRAVEAARVPELLNGLGIGVDARTAQDLLETEAWWAPFRSQLAYSAIIVGDEVLASVGTPVSGVARNPLIGQARDRGAASGVVGGEGRAYLIAMARVARSKRSGPLPVIAVAQPLDERALSGAADRTGDALGMSDGHKLIDSAGPADARPALAGVAGREAERQVLLSPRLVAVATQVAPGLWLWSAFAGAPPAGGNLPLAGGLGGLALALLIGAVLARPRAGGRPTTAEYGALAPAGTGESPQPRPSSRPEAAVRPSGETASPMTAQMVAPVGTARASVRAQPAETDVMGRYRLMSRIGEGGMATVYLATAHGAEGFARHFVVKRLHPHLTASPEATSQFIDEARLQAGLSHSNIVSVVDFGRAGDEFFLALEYIHGRDLEHILRRHMERVGRPLEPAIVYYVLAEVLDALAYAHTKADDDGVPMQLVHRDIAPGNVLVSYHGDVKLSDFGIVKADRRMSKTLVGTVKGNASFMSPEQARGDEVDHRSDLFSTGVVMYYLLTGQLLYQADGTLNQLLRAAVGPATTQFKQLEALPPDAARILGRALAPDPAHRYQTAKEFAAELDALSAGVKPRLGELMKRLFPDEMKRRPGG